MEKIIFRKKIIWRKKIFFFISENKLNTIFKTKNFIAKFNIIQNLVTSIFQTPKS